MKRDRNHECYLSLDKRRYAGKYVVICNGEFIGGGRNVERYIRIAWKKYPRSVPFVAWIRDPGKMYVFRSR